MSYLEEQIKKLGYISYEHYLRTKRWKEFSVKVKGKECFCCGDNKYLQVHHISYQNLENEKESDVVTVCGNCHQIIHEICKDRLSTLDEAHTQLKENLKYYKSNKDYNKFVGVKKKKTVKKKNKRSEWYKNHKKKKRDKAKAKVLNKTTIPVKKKSKGYTSNKPKKIKEVKNTRNSKRPLTNKRKKMLAEDKLDTTNVVKNPALPKVSSMRDFLKKVKEGEKQ